MGLFIDLIDTGRSKFRRPESIKRELVPSSPLTVSTTMAVDKASLASQLQGSVLVEGDEGYDAQLKRWADNAERKAAYIALPETAEDISKTVSYFRNLLI
jgi:hypothetical protein